MRRHMPALAVAALLWLAAPLATTARDRSLLGNKPKPPNNNNKHPGNNNPGGGGCTFHVTPSPARLRRLAAPLATTARDRSLLGNKPKPPNNNNKHPGNNNPGGGGCFDDGDECTIANRCCSGICGWCGQCGNTCPECFPGAATVRRASAGGTPGPARLDDLAIGDAVECLVPSGAGYEPGTCEVYYYLNAKPGTIAEFLVLTYAAPGGGEGALEVSHSHQLYVLPAGAGTNGTLLPAGRAVQAADVAVGDALAVRDAATGRFAAAAVTKVGAARRNGAYTPLLTRGGLLVVDGIAAFSSIRDGNHAGQHWAHAAVWQAYAAGGRVPLDAAGVRRGDRLADMPHGFSAWHEEYTAAAGGGAIDWAGVEAEARAAVAAGGVYTRASALALVRNNVVPAACPARGGGGGAEAAAHAAAALGAAAVDSAAAAAAA